MNSTQIENCRKFYAIAQSKLAGDTSGHSLDHILRVVNNAVLITRSEAALRSLSDRRRSAASRRHRR